jgi:hypothetical protein
MKIKTAASGRRFYLWTFHLRFDRINSFAAQRPPIYFPSVASVAHSGRRINFSADSLQSMRLQRAGKFI